MDHKESCPELPRDEKTAFIYEELFWEDPVKVQSAEDVIEGIERAMRLEARPVLLEGVCERLGQLGVSCNTDDTDIILSEIKRRYKEILGISAKDFPKAVSNWLKGKAASTDNRRNNYELCFALEMDLKQTAEFFQKYFYTLPFNVKSSTDAIFMYALNNRMSYSAAEELLKKAEGFLPQETAHTATSKIADAILGFDDDEEFLQYLSKHCYNNEQQFQLARNKCNDEIDKVKQKILKKANNPYDETAKIVSPNRLNSLTIEQLLGYKCQNCSKSRMVHTLPKHFTESLPKDVTLGKIINDDVVSYEVLRKALMLLKFYNYYSDAEAADQAQEHEASKYEINERLMDFRNELNDVLFSCGFALIYERHPFDCLLMYCANTYEPIVTMHTLNERN